MNKARLIGIIARLKTISTEIGALEKNPSLSHEAEGRLIAAQDEVEKAIEYLEKLK